MMLFQMIIFVIIVPPHRLATSIFPIDKKYAFNSELLMTPDNSRMLLYSNYQQSPLIYDLYSSSILNKTDPYFFESSYHRLFFHDSSNNSKALYCKFMGETIIRKYGVKEEFEDVTVYQQYCLGAGQGLAVSSDGQRWVRTCPTSNHIIIGFVQASQSNQVIKIEVESNISNVLCQPADNKLVMTTIKYSYPQNYSLISMDLMTNTTSVLLHSDHIIKMEFFSPDGLLFLFFNHAVCSYNFTSKEFTQFKADFPLSDVKGIKRRGQFMVLDLLFRDAEAHHWEYYYEFGVSNFTEDNVFFKIEVQTVSNSSTSEGSFLYAQPKNQQDGTNLTIYKLCNKQGWYYHSQNHQCQLCDGSCLGCLYKSTSCTSCHQGYYLAILIHSCVQCSSVTDLCVRCSNASHCTKCMEGYTLFEALCQSCSSFLDGCSRSLSVDKCIKCEESYDIDEISYQCQVRSNNWVIFLMVLLGTMLLLGLFLFILRQRRKSKQDANLSIMLKEQRESIDSQLQY